MRMTWAAMGCLILQVVMRRRPRQAESDYIADRGKSPIGAAWQIFPAQPPPR